MKLYELYEIENGALTEAAEDRRILLEADYKSMFPKDLMDVARPRINDEIKEAKRILKKSDRIVWYLRILKLYLYQRMVDKHPEFTERFDVELEQYNKKTKGRPLDRRSVAVMSMPMASMEHFFGLGIAKIDEYEFKWQLPREILEEFQNIEIDWKATRKQLIPNDPDLTVMIKMGDFAWFDLESPSCSIEADAMGHCGNSPASRDSNQTILSLRQKKMVGNEIWWRPVATFILHKREGMLGEMKGRNNKKPEDKYHKYIIPLLEHKRIKGIKGGGYLPSENFSINDLPDAVRDKLLAKKPALMSHIEYIVKEGFESYLDVYGSDGFDYEIDASDSKFPIIYQTYKNLSEVIEYLGNDDAKHIAGYVIDGDFLDIDTGSERADMISYTNTQEAARIKKYLEAKFAAEIEDQQLELDTINEIVGAIKELDYDTYNDLLGAVHDGYESGTSGAMYEALMDAVRAVTDENVLLDIPADKIDGEYQLRLSYEVVDADIANNSEYLQDLDDINDRITTFVDDEITVDVDSPRDGWYDFDEDAFHSRLDDLMDEAGIPE